MSQVTSGAVKELKKRIFQLFVQQTSDHVSIALMHIKSFGNYNFQCLESYGVQPFSNPILYKNQQFIGLLVFAKVLLLIKQCRHALG